MFYYYCYELGQVKTDHLNVASAYINDFFNGGQTYKKLMQTCTKCTIMVCVV